MKFKLLASSVLMAGALMGSGAASATVSWYWAGSLSDWITNGGIVDSNPPSTLIANGGTLQGSSTSANPSGDGDTTFTYLGGTLTTGIAPSTPTDSTTPLLVTLSEQEVNNIDFYKVKVDWVGNSTPGYFDYKISTTDAEGLSLAALDTAVATTGEVKKDIYSDAAMTNLLATFDSVNSARIPLTGFNPIGTYQTLYVRDTIISGTVSSISNEFTSVPEIDATSATSALTLLFAALGLLSNRRRTQADLTA